MGADAQQCTDFDPKLPLREKRTINDANGTVRNTLLRLDHMDVHFWNKYCRPQLRRRYYRARGRGENCLECLQSTSIFFAHRAHFSSHFNRTLYAFLRYSFGDTAMQLLIFFACLLSNLRYAEAALKTHIYIDQVPIYSKLAPCAQDRISAIVRAQSSGCGDDMQLTSFACFCVDSSSEFASVISTAVVDQCGATATKATLTARHVIATPIHRLRARVSVTSAPNPTGAVAGNVRSALEAFDSYCSKSTELTRCKCILVCVTS